MLENKGFMHALLINVVQILPYIYTFFPLHTSILESLLIGT